MEKRLHFETVSIKEMKISEMKAAYADQGSCLSVHENKHFHFLIPLFSASCYQQDVCLWYKGQDVSAGLKTMLVAA